MATGLMLAAVAAAAPVQAQARAGAQQVSEATGIRPLAVAKWGMLAGSAAAATWGVLEARRADDAYAALEARCALDEALCARRLPTGAYEDVALEADYRAVVRRDRRAGRALLAGEVGFAATVILFVLDLRNAGPPETIPYDPRLRLLPARDGGVRVLLTVPGFLP